MPANGQYAFHSIHFALSFNLFFSLLAEAFSVCVECVHTIDETRETEHKPFSFDVCVLRCEFLLTRSLSSLYAECTFDVLVSVIDIGQETK